MEEPKEPLVLNEHFLYSLGTFYAGWSFVELLVSWAIGKFLSLPYEETHILTGGMEFGKAANLLRQVVSRSDHKNRGAILAALGKLQNDSKRNVLAHSFLVHQADKIVFLERPRGGKFKLERHEFGLFEFSDHVSSMLSHSNTFRDAVGITDDDLNAFGNAGLNLNAKSKTSRDPPDSNAD